MRFPKLKGKRVEMGYTQAAMASKLSISTGAYALKELGRRQFNTDEICKILDILECKFEDIFLSGAIVYNILIKKNIINHDIGPLSILITWATPSLDALLIVSAILIIDSPNNGTNNINRNNNTINTVIIIAFIFLAKNPLSFIP